MGIVPQYYGGHTAATSTGGGVSVSTTIQTIVKNGILVFRPRGNTDVPVGAPIRPTDGELIIAGRSIALFPDGIPTHYELYYNGQWYNKGQLNEIKLSTTSFEFTNLIWNLASDVLEMKYQIVVSA